MDVKAKSRIFEGQLRQLAGQIGRAVKLANRPKAKKPSADTKENQAGFKDAMRQSGRASKAQENTISQGEAQLSQKRKELNSDMQRLNDALSQHKPVDDTQALKAELARMMQDL